MSSAEITFDTNYLYKEGERFFPIIQEKDPESMDAANGVLILVDALSEEWEEAYLLAEQAVLQDKWIFWSLDFHFYEKPVFLQDSGAFYALGLVMEEFVKRLLDPFKEKSIGVCLFKDPVDFSRYFVWTELEDQYYEEKKKEMIGLQEEALAKELFAADVFSDYLHRLASFLPDSILPFCLLDVSSVESKAFLAFLLSKERFQHLLLALKKSPLPLGHLNWEEGACLGGWIGRGAPYFSSGYELHLGVCIPSQELISEQLLALLDRLLDVLVERGVPFRVITESRLNECWEGLDDLIVLGDFVSDTLLRKLRGFVAAGGRVVTVGESLGLEEEVSFASLQEEIFC